MSKTQTVHIQGITRSWWRRVKALANKNDVTIKSYFIQVFHRHLLEHDPEYAKQYRERNK